LNGGPSSKKGAPEWLCPRRKAKGELIIEAGDGLSLGEGTEESAREKSARGGRKKKGTSI